MALDASASVAVSRHDLLIDVHESDAWLNPKPTSQLLCSEPQHTKGSNARGCRMCSKPVCEGCIIKASFGKQENTFKNRRRRFCDQCWLSGNRHAGARMDDPCAKRMPYTAFAEAGNFCCCTTDDGWLCLRCKTAQIEDLALTLNKCCGQGCWHSLDDDETNRRICLWCGSPLDGRLAKDEARRLHDSRHLYAKSNSHIEKPAFIAGWLDDGPLWSDQVESQFESFNSPSRIPQSRLLTAQYHMYLRHLGEVNYDALRITPPATEHIIQSCRGSFKYDIDFLLQFRRLCSKALVHEWELHIQPVRSKADLSFRPANCMNRSESIHPEPATQQDMPVLSLDTYSKERDEDDAVSTRTLTDQRPKVPSPIRIGKQLFLRLKLRRRRTSPANQVPEMSMRDNEASRLLDMSANQSSLKSCASVTSFSTYASKDLYHGNNTLTVGRSIV